MDLQEIKTKYLKKRFIIPGVIVLAEFVQQISTPTKLLTRQKSSKNVQSQI